MMLHYCDYKRGYCSYNSCAFLVNGEVKPCRFLPNKNGYFSLPKRGSGGVNPVVLSSKRFVRRVR
jgi:hypothetical protein